MKRGLDIRGLAEHAGVEYTSLTKILAGHRAGGLTWARIRRVTTPDEQRVIVQMCGPVFGKDWADETEPELAALV